MHTILALVLGVITIGYAFGRVLDKTNPRAAQRLELWQKSVGLAAFILAVVIVITPEFAALGLLGDATFFDLLVLLVSLQLQSVAVQARWWLAGFVKRVMWWMMTPRMSYLLVLSVWVAIAGLVSHIAGAFRRISS